MARNDWVRITQRRYRAEDFEMNGIPGRISLLQMDAVSQPLSVDHLGQSVTIVDVGYSWLQIALHGEYFWFTAMFNAQGRFQQIYVDITAGNTANVDDAFFMDMYLDYVVLPDRVVELDMDELEEAYAQGIITREAYETTLTQGKRIYNWLRADRQQIIDLVTREYHRMKSISD